MSLHTESDRVSSKMEITFSDLVASILLEQERGEGKEERNLDPNTPTGLEDFDVTPKINTTRLPTYLGKNPERISFDINPSSCETEKGIITLGSRITNFVKKHGWKSPAVAFGVVSLTAISYFSPIKIHCPACNMNLAQMIFSNCCLPNPATLAQISLAIITSLSGIASLMTNRAKSLIEKVGDRINKFIKSFNKV